MVHKFKQNHNCIFDYKNEIHSEIHSRGCKSSGKTTRIKLQQDVFFNSLSCKIILCVFDSDNGEFHTQTPDEAGAAVNSGGELVFPSLDRCRCFQEDCSAAGLPANFVQIGCNCWY